MILASYGGSADAQAAIDRVGKLMPGAHMTVLTVWEPFLDMLTRGASMGGGLAMSAVYVDNQGADATSEKAALENATEGAKRARAAGLVAVSRIACQHGSVGQAVLAVADDVDAELVVLGTRGRSGVKSFLLGSVSHEVTQHADRAVLVVPGPGLAEERRGWAQAPEPVAGAA